MAVVRGSFWHSRPEEYRQNRKIPLTKTSMEQTIKTLSQTLNELDAVAGKGVLNIGRHAGKTFVQVSTYHPDYANWTSKVVSKSKDESIINFKKYLFTRWMMVQDACGELNYAEIHELRQRLHEERIRHQRSCEAVLNERLRTSKAEQLLSLTNDVMFFQENILGHLEIEDILHISSVCVALRAVTVDDEGWPEVVARGMARHRRTLHSPPGTTPALKLCWSKDTGCLRTRRDLHDKRARAFFGVPFSFWKLAPIEFDAEGNLLGFAEHRDLGALVKQEFPSYNRMWNEVRLSVSDWQKKSNAVRRLANSFATNSVSDAALKLCNANTRLRAALKAVTTFHAVHQIRTSPMLKFPPDAASVEFELWRRLSNA